MAVSIGDLTERVTFQSSTRTSDSMGGGSEVWADDARVWANVRPVRGQEVIGSGRVEAKSTYLFTIRNRAVSEAQRIIWGGVAYNIRRVKREGSRPIYLTIEAERGAAQ